jgi:hypothetical protein
LRFYSKANPNYAEEVFNVASFEAVSLVSLHNTLHYPLLKRQTPAMNTANNHATCLIGRQPILDANEEIVSYELLFRSVDSHNKALINDAPHATANVIINSNLTDRILSMAWRAVTATGSLQPGLQGINSHTSGE